MLVPWKSVKKKKKELMGKAVSLLLQAETNQGYSYGITLRC